MRVKSLSLQGLALWKIVKRIIKISFSQDGLSRKIKNVSYYYPMDDMEYLEYQKYYLYGLREKCFVKKITDEFVRDQKRPPPWTTNDSSSHSTHVGQYLFELRDGKKIRVAIDAHDHRNIRSERILEWADIYFKSNYWPEINYGNKVYPIVNGNSHLSVERAKKNKKLRNSAKNLDLVFISRIWAGGDSCLDHNIRIFEKISQIRAEIKLLAIFAGFDLGSADFLSASNRLTKAGVPWTFEYLGYESLMLLSAESECTLIRAGVSLCIPWRMVDLLSLGACIIVDNLPFPRWPHPLEVNKNYISLDINLDSNSLHAPDEDYEKIVEKIYSILQDHELQSSIRGNNQSYFDQYAHPEKVAEFILQKIVALN